MPSLGTSRGRGSTHAPTGRNAARTYGQSASRRTSGADAAPGRCPGPRKDQYYDPGAPRASGAGNPSPAFRKYAAADGQAWRMERPGPSEDTDLELLCTGATFRSPSISRKYSAGVVSPGVAPSNPSPTVIVVVYLAGWHGRRGGRCAQLGFVPYVPPDTVGHRRTHAPGRRSRSSPDVCVIGPCLGAAQVAVRCGNQYLKTPSLKCAEPAGLGVTGMPSRLDSCTGAAATARRRRGSKAAVNTHLSGPAREVPGRSKAEHRRADMVRLVSAVSPVRTPGSAGRPARGGGRRPTAPGRVC